VDLLEASRARLFTVLSERSFEERDVVLASGRRSNFYIDCKQTTLTAEGHLLVGRLLFAELVRSELGAAPFVGVGGLTLGADPMASAVSLTSALAGHPIPAFIVRKEAKGHGTGAWIEGIKGLTPGGRVAILEDVVTTGGSAEKAITRAREAGFVVDLVLALVDREEGGREALEAQGVRLVSLFEKKDFFAGRATPAR
jgi:orotate phosphoribosyltransferase